MRLPDLLTRFDLFLFDMDGTLVLGDKALPGAVELIAALKKENMTIRYITNHTMHSADHQAMRLSKAGIDARPEDILNPMPALLDWARENDIERAHVIASDMVKAALGYLDAGDDPQAVILGLCQNWDYKHLQLACNYAARGVPVVMCQPDPYCPDPDGNIPDSGALLALMETTLCRKLDPIVLGKPSPALIQPILKQTGIDPARAILFGDRLKTDIEMAKRAGVQGALVLTGQTKRGDVTDAGDLLIYDSVADAL